MAMIPPEVQTVFTCMSSAVLYSLIFYAKKRVNKGEEKLDVKKLAATLVVGAAVGVAYGYYGMPVTQASISEQLVTYTGTIALVESGIKFLYRAYKQRTS